MEGRYIVYGSPGSGSVPVEAALTLIGTPYEVIGETVLRDLAHNLAVLKVNPLGQVPALVLPGGDPMRLVSDERRVEVVLDRIADRRADCWRWMDAQIVIGSVRRDN
jgi:glutathione S-transferase